MSFFFDIANWLILGGAVYLILDLIPNGPLSWKVLSKYSSQTSFAVRTVLILGALIVAIQFFLISAGIFLFAYEDWSLNAGSKPLQISSMFLIPLIAQLFRIKSISNKPTGRAVVSFMILASCAVFWIYVPSPVIETETTSLLGGFENTLLFNYLCGILLFFIVLDVSIILKKHKIIK